MYKYYVKTKAKSYLIVEKGKDLEIYLRDKLSREKLSLKGIIPGLTQESENVVQYPYLNVSIDFDPKSIHYLGHKLLMNEVLKEALNMSQGEIDREKAPKETHLKMTMDSRIETRRIINEMKELVSNTRETLDKIEKIKEELTEEEKEEVKEDNITYRIGAISRLTYQDNNFCNVEGEERECRIQQEMNRKIAEDILFEIEKLSEALEESFVLKEKLSNQPNSYDASSVVIEFTKQDQILYI